jgi:predicted ATPase
MKIPMRISAINVKGYRSLHDVEWRPGALNVIIGPNATGKSNFLSFLAMMTEAAKGNLGEYVYSQGGMGAITFFDKVTAISVDLRIEGVDTPELDRLEYRFTIKRLGVGGDFFIDAELENDWIGAKGPRHGIDFSKGGNLLIRYVERNGAATQEMLDRLPSLVRQTETILSSPQVPVLGDGMLIGLQDFIKSWIVYSDWRTDPDAPVRKPAVSRRAETLDSDCSNLTAVLHTHYSSDLTFRDNVDYAMTAAFGDAYKELTFLPGAEQQIQLAIRWSAFTKPVVAANLSDGTLRFLAMIAALSQPNLPGLLAIDEPETGLHPSMLPIIAEYAAGASARSQVIMTTHSVQFLDAFRDQAPATTVADVLDGKTTLTVMDKERLDYWLKEYSLGSLYRSGQLDNMAVDIREKDSESKTPGEIGAQSEVSR